MKYLEILVFALISSVYSTNPTQDVPPNLQTTTINGKNVKLDTGVSPISVVPQPPASTSKPNTTTLNPNTSTLNPNTTTSKTTVTTPITKPTTPIPTTTKPPTTPASNVTTTPASNVTTTPASNVTTTPVPTNTTTFSPVTTAKPVNPTPTPDHHRRFDGPSFVGGIVLALGLVAIGFVAFKFYKARTELNYHTL